jgi:hypothetical protein
MTEKTYTAAEVAILLEAERAKSAKPVKVAWKVGESKKTGKAYEGIQVSGDFFPVYLTPKAAKAILSVSETILALLAEGPPKDEPEAPEADPLAPRIAPKA